jgi:hypothetical protein
VTAERPLEMRNVRHHETKLGIGIGELALQVQEITAGNMPGFERVTSGHCEIGEARPFGCGFEISGAVEQAQVRLAENIGKFRRRYESVTP